MRSSGAMLLSRVADVFLRHRLQQRFLRFLRQVLEYRRGILPRHDAKDDHLVFEAELGQKRRHVAGVAIAKHVSQPRVVARAKHGGKLVGGASHFSDRRDRVVALRPGQLLFHLFQRCSDDVVMVHVWTDRLDGVEPHAVNQIEVAWE